jgi:hypothetical protein
MSWKDDKRWSDVFMPEIKSILGMHLLGEAPHEEDATRATDLIVLKMEAVRIAVRMRKKSYGINPMYREEFTIRSERGSGTKTELRKVMEGFGDFLFYGFEHQEGGRLGRWTIVDLAIFRGSMFEKTYMSNAGVLPGDGFVNTDGSSSFRVFRYADFPRSLVRAKGEGMSVCDNAQLMFV